MRKVVLTLFCLSCLWGGVLFAAEASTNKWDGELNAFAAADQKAMPPSNGVLFVGSSSFRLWTNLAQSFPRLQTINRGFGGSHITDVLQFADKIILPYKPSKVVIYAGENDIAANKPPEGVALDFRKLVEKIHSALPGTHIYYVSMKPSPSRWKMAEQIRRGNELVRTQTEKDPRLHYVDIFPAMLSERGEPRPELFVKDMLHMNEQGYEIWTQILLKELR